MNTQTATTNIENAKAQSTSPATSGTNAPAKAQKGSGKKADTSKAANSVAKAKSGKKGGRQARFPDDAVIKVLQKDPAKAKRKGTKAFKMYEILLANDGKTVGEYKKDLEQKRAKNKLPEDYSAVGELSWCVKKEFVKVEAPAQNQKKAA